MTGDVPLSSAVVMVVLCLVGWSVLVGLLQPPSPWWVWALGLPVVAGVVWLMSGPRYLWLEGADLVVQERGRRQTLPLRDIVRVDRRWVPYKGEDLVLVGRTGPVRIVSLEVETEPLRHELGRRLPDPDVQVRDPRARELLGLGRTSP